MKAFKVKFVVGEISEEEFGSLKKNEVVIAKMIMIPDDFEMFRYAAGELIEVQTSNGNRLWCIILNMEIIKDEERVIIIFTLMKSPAPELAFDA